MTLGRRYGPLMFIKLGTVPHIIVQSPEMAKEVLRTCDHIWGSRPRTITAEIFFYGQQDLLFAPLGPLFKLFRKTCLNNMFTRKRVEYFQVTRKETLVKFLQKLLQESRGGNPIDVDNKVTEMNFNNVSKVLYGKCYYGMRRRHVDGSYQTREFHEIAAEWAKVAGSIIVGDFMPCLRKLDIGKAEAHLNRLREEFNDFLSSVIEEHRAALHRPEPGTEDMVDVLLSLPADGDGRRLTDTQIKCVLTDFTLGGIDSTAAQIQWTLIELMRNPEYRLRAQAELDSVVGKERVVQESDLPDLPLLKSIIKESFRLHPAVPFLAPHESIEESTISGYKIPKGTRLIVNVYGIHRSPNVWTNPDKFNPDRFLDPNEAGKSVSNDFKLIPFGSGRRQCPAMEYATLTLEWTVAAILHTCDLSLPKGVKPEDIDIGESFGVTLTSNSPLKLTFSPRLPLKVYEEAGIAL